MSLSTSPSRAETSSAASAQRGFPLAGLLWAMRFDEAGRGHLVDPPEDLSDLGGFGQGFLWLHFDLTTAQLDAIFRDGQLGPPRLATCVFSTDEHQRVTVEGSYIGGVVADLTRDEEREADAGTDGVTGRLHFVLGPRLLVSGRRERVESPDAARAAATEGARFTSPILLLERLIGYVIASIAASGSNLADEVDAIEDHILEERVRGDRRRLGPIRRDAVRLHRQLLGLRAVFHRLEEDGTTEQLPDLAVTTAARIAQRLDALDRDMNLIAERSRLLQEELSARLAEQSNRQLYTLSILTALFLPPTLITGVFGINTKGLPFAENEHGSWIVIGLALLSAVLAYGAIRVLGIRAPRE